MWSKLRGMAAILAAVFLAGCGQQNTEFEKATASEVQEAAYRHNGPARLTLFTMVSNDRGTGAHTALMVNASQRVIFDPAGSFRHENITTRNDVVFGATPYLVDSYTRFHARETYHVIVQELDVSPETAELALQKVLAHGPVASAHCANSTSGLLASLPGFERIKRSYFPNKVSQAFGTFEGVRSQSLYEYDSDDKTKVLREWVPEGAQPAG